MWGVHQEMSGEHSVLDLDLRRGPGWSRVESGQCRLREKEQSEERAPSQASRYQHSREKQKTRRRGKLEVCGHVVDIPDDVHPVSVSLADVGPF